MHDDSQYDPFIKDPNLLLDSCRVVIDHLSSNLKKSAEIEAAEAQLKEISYSIERLEKIGISIPDALRQEKIRLAVFLSTMTDNKKILINFANELKEILIDLDSRLNDSRYNPNKSLSRTTGSVSKRTNSKVTDSKTLQAHIIMALKKLGGSATAAEVKDEMRIQLEGKLLPGDMEYRINKKGKKTLCWIANTGGVRINMIKDGILKEDSPYGIWELNEEYL